MLEQNSNIIIVVESLVILNIAKFPVSDVISAVCIVVLLTITDCRKILKLDLHENFNK